MVEQVKLGFPDAGVSKNIYIKEKLGWTLNIFYWILVFKLNQAFTKTLATFGFGCISVKHLVFEVNTLLVTSTKILMITELRN